MSSRMTVGAAALFVVLSSGCADDGPKPWAMRPITQDYTFPARDEAGEVIPEGMTVSAADLDKGRRSYVHYCYACHGMDGDGQGPSSHGLRPPPRDFRTANFKFGAVRSGELPNDDDLMRIIKGGLHGTAMLPWDVPDEELWRIIQFIKTFPQAKCDPETGGEKCLKELEEFPDGKPSKWLETYDKGKKAGQPRPTGEPVVITEDPWQGKAAEAVQRGSDLYHAKAQCANCHAAYLTKKEFYEASLRIDKDYPITSFRDGMYGSIVLAAKDNPYGVNIMPPDFTLNPVRSIREGQELPDLYRLIASGVGGVMPAWIDGLKQDDLWALAHFVKSMMDLRAPENREELHKLRDKLANQPPWSPPSKEPKNVTIAVDEQGGLQLDGKAVESTDALLEELKKLAADHPVVVTIEAAKAVKHEDAVAVVDKVKEAGIEKVALKIIDAEQEDGDEEKEAEGDTSEAVEAPAPPPAPEAPGAAPKAPAPKAPAPKAPAPAPANDPYG